MIHFVTHFDEQFLPQATAMLESLKRHSQMAIIWVMPLTAECHLMAQKKFPVIPLEFSRRYAQLMLAKIGRTWREFCWMAEPIAVESLMDVLEDGDVACYVDADQFFFADPVPGILAALDNADVALSPHHFPPGQEHREKSVGRFNFGIGAFRACDATRKLVAGWLAQTLERCDEHAAGDQKYLDEWPAVLGERFAELPRGMNCGPWQLSEVVPAYDPTGRPMPLLNEGDDLVELVSFHFHEFRRGTGKNPITLNGASWNRSNYQLHPSTIETVYRKYEAELIKWL